MELPDSHLGTIKKDFAKDDERRRTAAVSFFLTYHPYASWRLLIHRLDYWQGEHSTSEHLHPYAEKLTGMLDLNYTACDKYGVNWDN